MNSAQLQAYFLVYVTFICLPTLYFALDYTCPQCAVVRFLSSSLASAPFACLRILLAACVNLYLHFVGHGQPFAKTIDTLMINRDLPSTLLFNCKGREYDSFLKACLNHAAAMKQLPQTNNGNTTITSSKLTWIHGNQF